MTSVAYSDLAPLAQADLLGYLAAAFTSPSALAELALTPSDEIHGLIDAAGFGESAELKRAFDETHAQIAAVDSQAVEAEHAHAFWAQASCPPYESAFVRRDKGAILGDIAGFYEAFGFRADQPGERRADHLVCELEFVAALLVMAATSRAQGAAEQTRIVESALDHFAWDHLGDWLPGFCERLSATVPGGVMDAAANALAGLWDALVLAHNWPTGAVPDYVEDTGTPYECPMATEASWTPVEFVPEPPIS